MNKTTKAPGPLCKDCGAFSVRAVRARSIAAERERVYYLAYLWTCTSCAEEWIDDSLAQMNDFSARSARAMAGRRQQRRLVPIKPAVGSDA